MGVNGVTRRTLLLGLGALPLAGCGVRFESDEPWFVPTPSPDPAGPSVLAERAHVAALRTTLAGARPAVAPHLVSITDTQLAALDATLAALDPPVPAPAPQASPPVTATPSTSSAGAPGAPAGLTPAAAARVALSGLRPADLGHLDELLPRVAPVLVASAAQRIVTAAQLAPTATVDAVLPVSSWRTATPAVTRGLLDAVRAAAYAVEVAASRLPEPRTTLARATLSSLREVEQGLSEAMPDAPPRPLGHRLPGRIDSPARVAALLDGVLTRLGEAAIAAVSPSVAALQDSPGSTTPTVAPTTPTSTTLPGTSGSVPGTGGALVPVLRLATTSELARLRLGGRPRPLPLLTAQAAATADPTPTSPPRSTAS